MNLMTITIGGMQGERHGENMHGGNMQNINSNSFLVTPTNSVRHQMEMSYGNQTPYGNTGNATPFNNGIMRRTDVGGLGLQAGMQGGLGLQAGVQRDANGQPFDQQRPPGIPYELPLNQASSLLQGASNIGLGPLSPMPPRLLPPSEPHSMGGPNSDTNTGTTAMSSKDQIQLLQLQMQMMQMQMAQQQPQQQMVQQQPQQQSKIESTSANTDVMDELKKIGILLKNSQTTMDAVVEQQDQKIDALTKQLNNVVELTTGNWQTVPSQQTPWPQDWNQQQSSNTLLGSTNNRFQSFTTMENGATPAFVPQHQQQQRQQNSQSLLGAPQQPSVRQQPSVWGSNSASANNSALANKNVSTNNTGSTVGLFKAPAAKAESKASAIFGAGNNSSASGNSANGNITNDGSSGPPQCSGCVSCHRTLDLLVCPNCEYQTCKICVFSVRSPEKQELSICKVCYPKYTIPEPSPGVILTQEHSTLHSVQDAIMSGNHFISTLTYNESMAKTMTAEEIELKTYPVGSLDVVKNTRLKLVSPTTNIGEIRFGILLIQTFEVYVKSRLGVRAINRLIAAADIENIFVEVLDALGHSLSEKEKIEKETEGDPVYAFYLALAANSLEFSPARRETWKFNNLEKAVLSATLSQHAVAFTSEGHMWLMEWNNYKRRHHEQVMPALRKLILLAGKIGRPTIDLPKITDVQGNPVMDLNGLPTYAAEADPDAARRLETLTDIYLKLDLGEKETSEPRHLLQKWRTCKDCQKSYELLGHIARQKDFDYITGNARKRVKKEESEKMLSNLRQGIADGSIKQRSHTEGETKRGRSGGNNRDATTTKELPRSASGSVHSHHSQAGNSGQSSSFRRPRSGSRKVLAISSDGSKVFRESTRERKENSGRAPRNDRTPSHGRTPGGSKTFKRQPSKPKDGSGGPTAEVPTSKTAMGSRNRQRSNQEQEKAKLLQFCDVLSTGGYKTKKSPGTGSKKIATLTKKDEPSKFGELKANYLMMISAEKNNGKEPVALDNAQSDSEWNSSQSNSSLSESSQTEFSTASLSEATSDAVTDTEHDFSENDVTSTDGFFRSVTSEVSGAPITAVSKQCSPSTSQTRILSLMPDAIPKSKRGRKLRARKLRARSATPMRRQRNLSQESAPHLPAEALQPPNENAEVTPPKKISDKCVAIIVDPIMDMIDAISRRSNDVSDMMARASKLSENLNPKQVRNSMKSIHFWEDSGMKRLGGTIGIRTLLLLALFAQVCSLNLAGFFEFIPRNAAEAPLTAWNGDVDHYGVVYIPLAILDPTSDAQYGSYSVELHVVSEEMAGIGRVGLGYQTKKILMEAGMREGLAHVDSIDTSVVTWEFEGISPEGVSTSVTLASLDSEETTFRALDLCDYSDPRFRSQFLFGTAVTGVTKTVRAVQGRRNSSRKNSKPKKKSVPASKKRKQHLCGICHCPGHNARNCPSKKRQDMIKAKSTHLQDSDYSVSSSKKWQNVIPQASRKRPRDRNDIDPGPVSAEYMQFIKQLLETLPESTFADSSAGEQKCVHIGIMYDKALRSQKITDHTEKACAKGSTIQGRELKRLCYYIDAISSENGLSFSSDPEPETTWLACTACLSTSQQHLGVDETHEGPSFCISNSGLIFLESESGNQICHTKDGFPTSDESCDDASYGHYVEHTCHTVRIEENQSYVEVPDINLDTPYGARATLFFFKSYIDKQPDRSDLEKISNLFAELRKEKPTDVVQQNSSRKTLAKPKPIPMPFSPSDVLQQCRIQKSWLKTGLAKAVEALMGQYSKSRFTEDVWSGIRKSIISQANYVNWRIGEGRRSFPSVYGRRSLDAAYSGRILLGDLMDIVYVERIIVPTARSGKRGRPASSHAKEAKTCLFTYIIMPDKYPACVPLRQCLGDVESSSCSIHDVHGIIKQVEVAGDLVKLWVLDRQSAFTAVSKTTNLQGVKFFYTHSHVGKELSLLGWLQSIIRLALRNSPRTGVQTAADIWADAQDACTVIGSRPWSPAAGILSADRDTLSPFFSFKGREPPHILNTEGTLIEQRARWLAACNTVQQAVLEHSARAAMTSDIRILTDRLRQSDVRPGQIIEWVPQESRGTRSQLKVLATYSGNPIEKNEEETIDSPHRYCLATDVISGKVAEYRLDDLMQCSNLTEATLERLPSELKDDDGNDFTCDYAVDPEEKNDLWPHVDNLAPEIQQVIKNLQPCRTTVTCVYCDKVYVLSSTEGVLQIEKEARRCKIPICCEQLLPSGSQTCTDGACVQYLAQSKKAVPLRHESAQLNSIAQQYGIELQVDQEASSSTGAVRSIRPRRSEEQFSIWQNCDRELLLSDGAASLSDCGPKSIRSLESEEATGNKEKNDNEPAATATAHPLERGIFAFTPQGELQEDAVRAAVHKGIQVLGLKLLRASSSNMQFHAPLVQSDGTSRLFFYRRTKNRMQQEMLIIIAYHACLKYGDWVICIEIAEPQPPAHILAQEAEPNMHLLSQCIFIPSKHLLILLTKNKLIDLDNKTNSWVDQAPIVTAARHGGESEIRTGIKIGAFAFQKKGSSKSKKRLRGRVLLDAKRKKSWWCKWAARLVLDPRQNLRTQQDNEKVTNGKIKPSLRASPTVSDLEMILSIIVMHMLGFVMAIVDICRAFLHNQLFDEKDQLLICLTWPAWIWQHAPSGWAGPYDQSKYEIILLRAIYGLFEAPRLWWCEVQKAFDGYSKDVSNNVCFSNTDRSPCVINGWCRQTESPTPLPPSGMLPVVEPADLEEKAEKAAQGIFEVIHMVTASLQMLVVMVMWYVDDGLIGADTRPRLELIFSLLKKHFLHGIESEFLEENGPRVGYRGWELYRTSEHIVLDLTHKSLLLEPCYIAPDRAELAKRVDELLEASGGEKAVLQALKIKQELRRRKRAGVEIINDYVFNMSRGKNEITAGDFLLYRVPYGSSDQLIYDQHLQSLAYVAMRIPLFSCDLLLSQNCRFYGGEILLLQLLTRLQTEPCYIRIPRLLRNMKEESIGLLVYYDAGSLFCLLGNWATTVSNKDYHRITTSVLGDLLEVDCCYLDHQCKKMSDADSNLISGDILGKIEKSKVGEAASATEAIEKGRCLRARLLTYFKRVYVALVGDCKVLQQTLQKVNVGLVPASGEEFVSPIRVCYRSGEFDWLWVSDPYNLSNCLTKPSQELSASSLQIAHHAQAGKLIWCRDTALRNEHKISKKSDTTTNSKSLHNTNKQVNSLQKTDELIQANANLQSLRYTRRQPHEDCLEMLQRIRRDLERTGRPIDHDTLAYVYDFLCIPSNSAVEMHDRWKFDPSYRSLHTLEEMCMRFQRWFMTREQNAA